MEKLINQTLNGRYHIQSLLSRKTGRRTFLASDLQTKLPVVIKLLLFGPDFAWDDLKLFEREAEVLKSIDHLALPQYLDFFEVDTESVKGSALVQTYIEARSLQDWIQPGCTFDEAELKTIARQILEILDYLHSRKPPIVHRDIKPSNILLKNHNIKKLRQIYLVDFGSVQTAKHSGTFTVVGTYGYMPPEQFGGQTEPASDLYALGATLIYLVTGRHPSELPQKEMQILFEDKVNLSPTFTAWLREMTQPSLDLRFKSAKQALGTLRRSSKQETTSTTATKSVVRQKLHGIITGDLIVSNEIEVHGTVNGRIIVESNGSLFLHGICNGNLIVQAGAKTSLFGSVNGDVVNKGETFIDSNSMVFGGIKGKVIVKCKSCSQRLRVPGNRNELTIVCPKCRASWVWTPTKESNKSVSIHFDDQESQKVFSDNSSAFDEIFRSFFESGGVKVDITANQTPTSNGNSSSPKKRRWWRFWQ